jgi:two-component system, NtrC family, sensor kinase
MSDRRFNILIADDHEEPRYVLSRILTAAGYHCSEASTGTQALEFALHKPDLIILDVRLPDMSGFDVCQKLKTDPRTTSIPILQISAAFVSIQDHVRSLDSGADVYLTHPIDRTVLAATVRSLLRLHDAEQKARKAADESASTFDALSEGLAIIDENNCLVRWNTAFQAMLGSAFQPAVGSAIGDFLADLSGIDLSLEDGDMDRHSAEFSIDGKNMQLSIGSITRDGEKNERIIIVSDITDRRLAEYAVRTAEKLAATGKLANAIAHEINNPLEALTNLIFLARSSDEMNFVRDLLERANQELDRISRITKQTLAFHRDTQNPIPVDLAQLLSEMIALYEKPSSAKRVHLVVDTRPIPPILGYAGQLSQVFGNLVRNATEAAPADSNVVVRVRPVHRDGRAEARITIHDRGKGIPRAVRRKIFDPFFTTKELKGSGLGLWVSKNLIEKHKGTIRFRTSERNGTTFAVFLPLADEPDPAKRPNRNMQETRRELLSA